MFREKSVQCTHPGGTHEIIYSEFPGDPEKTLVCVHGLSRNGQDFHILAQAMSILGYRVLCPDMAGRGRSKNFDNPAHYNYPQYISDLLTLMKETNTVSCDWVGTSMGGLIGMMIAAQPVNPIKKMVINDIGPYVSVEALERIKKYVSVNPIYPDWESFYEAFKKSRTSFGIKTEEDWHYMAKISSEETLLGGYQLNYDTHVVAALVGQDIIVPIELWPLWDQVKNEMLILHGAESDVLTNDTLQKMMINKTATAVSFAGVGHAPTIFTADQISVVKKFFTS